MKLNITLAVIAISFLSSLNAQIVVTESELLKFAQNNLERIYLLELNELHEHEIDSLVLKIETMQTRFDLSEKNNEDLKLIVSKLEQIDQKRKTQNAILDADNKIKKKTIDKQATKLKWFKVLTPVGIVGAFIAGLFTK